MFRFIIIIFIVINVIARQPINENSLLGTWVGKSGQTKNIVTFNKDKTFSSSCSDITPYFSIVVREIGTYDFETSLSNQPVLIFCNMQPVIKNGEETDGGHCTSDEFCIVWKIDGKLKLGWFNNSNKPHEIDSLLFIKESGCMYSKIK
jgi:hypothetical protein